MLVPTATAKSGCANTPHGALRPWGEHVLLPSTFNTVSWQISRAPSLLLMQTQQENIFRRVLWVPALSWWSLCRPMDLYPAPKHHLELVRSSRHGGKVPRAPPQKRGKTDKGDGGTKTVI